MSKAQKIEERRRQRRLIEREKSRKRQEEVVDKDFDLAHIDDDPDEETDETLTKEMGGMVEYSRPTSWDEMEALEETEEQQEELREISWTVQNLVYNIVCHPTMSPEEKTKAIQEVGSGFGERISGIVSGIKKAIQDVFNPTSPVRKMIKSLKAEQENNSLMIEKDAKGDWRWVGWVTNNYVDWDGQAVPAMASTFVREISRSRPGNSL